MTTSTCRSALQWAFERVANGLTVSSIDNSADTHKNSKGGAALPSLPSWIGKHYNSNVLFDESGQRQLTKEEADALTTWRSHHAFSGRCMLGHDHHSEDVSDKNAAAAAAAPATAASTPAPSSGAEGSPSWMESNEEAYRSWDAVFLLRSTNDEPHLLLSLAPYYMPYGASLGLHPDPSSVKQQLVNQLPWAPTSEEQELYDKRMLETPLIYEEPCVLSVECTPKGMFMWSDQWEVYGKKIAPTCLAKGNFEVASPQTSPRQRRTAPSYVDGYEGLVRLQWKMAPPSTTTTSSLIATGSSSNSNNADGDVHATLAVSVGVDISKESTAVLLSGTDSDKSRDSAFSAVSKPIPFHHGGGGGNGNDEKELMWKKVFETTIPVPASAARALFVPYVTLMEGGDEAVVL